jgi:tetratricopeptide (TPR) repeat protein
MAKPLRPTVYLPTILSVVLLVLSNTSTFAAGYFSITPGVRSSYQKIINLRLTEAKFELDVLKQVEPDNLMVQFIENYWECVSALLNDNERQYHSWSRNMNKRLDKIAKGDRQSPYYLYCQAEIRLQWAVLQGRYGEYLACAWNVKQGFALLEENQRRFPFFTANKKNLGVIHALAGNIPKEVKWAVKGISGISGTIDQGVREVEEVLYYSKNNPDFLFGVESMVTYAYLQLHLNNQMENAWTTMKDVYRSTPQNPLAKLALANIAMKTARNDEAIKLLQEMPKDKVYHPLPYQYLLLGIAKLYRLDKDANQPLLTFLQLHKGQFGIKEAYQKLAWHSLLQNDPVNYWGFIYQAKIQGISRADTDKAANREANSGEMPDPILLKSRLLSDGGYFQQAYQLLYKKGDSFSSHFKNHLEFRYRMGRICQKLGKTQEAIQYYQQTVETGAQHPWYFACNAAIQLGLIYEEKKDYEKARLYYKRANQIEPDEYAASLHARAKAGYNRVKNK